MWATGLLATDFLLRAIRNMQFSKNKNCAQNAIRNFQKLKIALNTQNAIACSQNHAISRNTQLNAALMGNRIKNNTPLILDFQHSV
jgi:hypothetical protein